MPEHHRCPWWLGYLLASPVRRLLNRPEQILSPYVHPGMTVLEPGPGMGFFTLQIARMVGPGGFVVAVDVEPRMLAVLTRRAAKAGVAGRVHARVTQPESLGIGDLAGQVDFVLAFAVVHELPDAGTFFAEAASAMKPGASMLLAEPKAHVRAPKFESELALAAAAGLTAADRPAIRGSHAAVLVKAQSAEGTVASP